MSTAATGVGSTGGINIYETDTAVHEYLQFHFAEDDQIMPYKCGPKEALHFPTRCAAEGKAAQGRKRALDIGCSVGGMTFALTEYFEEVVGIDFSQAFVDAADVMKKVGKASYRARVEADIFEECECKIPESSKPERAFFVQGDACALPPADRIGATEGGARFDAVLACNLLCRLPEPRAFLQSLPDLVAEGGVVVLVSPYSWLEQWTPKDKWIGGTVDAKTGQATRSFTVLQAEMEKDGKFKLEKEGEMPFLIREHCRKFQWGCSHLTVWRRTATNGAKGEHGGYSGN